MKKKVMVTGGAGMIGLEVCRQLSNLGIEVILLDLGEQIMRVKKAIPSNVKIYYGSICDLSSIRSAMSNCQIVFHLAAMLGVRRTEMDLLRCLEINIEGVKNILGCAVQFDVEKIVFASSSEVYGEPLGNPITEDFTTQGKSVYAITKLAGEELCKAYAQKYPIKYTILRYFNSYGPYQTAQFVISKFIKNVLEGKPPVINGDGNQIRSYTYVADTARATILSGIMGKADGQILNIGNGKQPVSIRELAETVIEIGGQKNKLKPEYRPDFLNADRVKDREIFERFCDSSKAENLLDWKAQINLGEGIRSIIENGVIFDRWEHLYDEQN